MQFTPNLKLTQLEQYQVAKEAVLNNNFNLIDKLLLSGVKSRKINSPSASLGDIYIVPITATGEFVDHENQLAINVGVKKWHFIECHDGALMFILDENSLVVKKNHEWYTLVTLK